MRNQLLGVILGVTLSAIAVHANDAAKPKGPEDDGTLPALVKIAGEGTMDSRAFDYLTELSDEVGARVTGSPSGQKAIDSSFGHSCSCRPTWRCPRAPAARRPRRPQPAC